MKSVTKVLYDEAVKEIRELRVKGDEICVGRMMYSRVNDKGNDDAVKSERKPRERE
jgi:hypothetical protein